MRGRTEHNLKKIKTDDLSELLCNIQFHLNSYGTWENDLDLSSGYVSKDFEIAYYTEGCTEITIGDVVYDCPAGSYLVLAPYQLCHVRNKSEDEIGKFYYFHFDIDESSLRHQFISLLTRHGNVIRKEEMKDLTSMFEIILKEEQEEQVGCKSVIQSALQRVVVELIRAQIRRGGSEAVEAIYSPYLKIVNEGIDYIQAHYKDAIRLGEVSKHLKISTSVLYKAFMQILNTPPATYIQQQKILACQKMLEEGKRVGTIYQELGFSSAYHLSKAFKQHVGVSPREYKKRLKIESKY